MNYTERQEVYQRIEDIRNTKVLAFITSDRLNMET